MRRRGFGILMVLSVLFPTTWPASATEGMSPIVGTWKLTNYTRMEVGTDKITHTFGEHPTGFITYTPGGHMIIFLAGDSRKAPGGSVSTDAQRTELFNTIIGAYTTMWSCSPPVSPDIRNHAPEIFTYTGTYSVEGDKVIHHVQDSWTQVWNDSNQVRHFEVNGNKLTLKSEPLKSPIDGKEIIAIATFEKEE